MKPTVPAPRGMFLAAWALRPPAMLLVALALGGCAQQAPPTGGPPDITPPVILSSSPDSGAVNVSRTEPLRVLFSKRMDRRSVEDYIFTSPPIRLAEVHWRGGRELDLVPQDSLRANTTYLALIGTGARDLHGNALERAENVVFSTGPRLSPGRVSGRVEAVRQSPGGIFVWMYQDNLHPDSTWGRDDPDFVGQVGADGRFEILGLTLGPAYSVHLFADVNRNRTFDPGSEYMLNLPHRVHLTDSVFADTTLEARYVDPKLPGSVAGRVDTTLADPHVSVRLESVSDTGASQTVKPDLRGGFLLRLTPPGKYRIFWFEDANGNGVPDPAEPRGHPLEIEVRAGEDLTELSLSRQGVPRLPPPRKDLGP